MINESEENYQLYSIGKNNRGGLGNGTNNNITTLTKIKAYNQNIINIINSNGGSTKVIFEDGLYECSGYNKYGQLGLGTFENVNTFQTVTKLQDLHIKNIFGSVTAENTFCINQSNEMYAVGYNESNQFGIKTQSKNENWIKIDKCKEKIMQIAMGAEHCLFLSTDHKMFAAGNNAYYQLGIGTTERSYCTPNITAVPTQYRFNRVYCGQFYSMAMDMNRNIWSWGRNDHGQTGHGKRIWYRNPTQIQFFVNNDLKIEKLCCGYHHNLAVSSHGTVECLYMSYVYFMLICRLHSNKLIVVFMGKE